MFMYGGAVSHMNKTIRENRAMQKSIRKYSKGRRLALLEKGSIKQPQHNKDQQLKKANIKSYKKLEEKLKKDKASLDRRFFIGMAFFIFILLFLLYQIVVTL